MKPQLLPFPPILPLNLSIENLSSVVKMFQRYRRTIGCSVHDQSRELQGVCCDSVGEGLRFSPTTF